MCPVCDRVVPLVADTQGTLTCGNADCGVSLQKCENFASHQICNRCLLAENATPDSHCDYCSLTTVIPDLSVPGNDSKWRRLERAKHRVLYTIEKVGLPFHQTDDPDVPVLSFEFKEDGEDTFHTGHQNGCITLNIREADDVEREKARVAFSEPKRTLAGHFRHELGHYFWDRLVKGQREDEFRWLFGDERNPSYTDALESYHANGPRENWRETFVAAYATMHPWEDFAETFRTYLDMVTVLDTAQHFEVTQTGFDDVDKMIASFQRVGLIANEFNRDMGLVDLVPEVLVPAVIEKLRFIHKIACESRGL